MIENEATVQDLHAAYHAIPDALAWLEAIIGDDVELQNLAALVWGGINCGVVIRMFQECLEEHLRLDNPANPDAIRRARDQMNHPQFARYMAGRLGLV